MGPLTPITVALALLLTSVSAAAGRVDVVSESELSHHWTPALDAMPVRAGYPTGGQDRSQDVCVNIGFLIDRVGKTSHFAELSSWTDGDSQPSQERVSAFVQSAAAAVSLWRFVPVGKARAVFTSSAFVFDGGKPDAPEAIAGHCRIDNLRAFVQHRTDESRKSALLRSRYEEGLRVTGRCTSFSSACVLAAD